MTSTEELRKKLLELLISEMQNSQHAVVMDEGNAFVVSKDYKKLAEKVLDPAILLFQEYSDARVKEALEEVKKIYETRTGAWIYDNSPTESVGANSFEEAVDYVASKLTTPAPSDSDKEKKE